MVEIFVILCAVIWFPILFYLLSQRGLSVLLVWLCIAPMATNLLHNPTKNPFFTAAPVEVDLDQPVGKEKTVDDYLYTAATYTLTDVLDPTRILFVLFLVVFLLDFVLHRRQAVPFDRTEFWMGLFSLVFIINVLLMSDRLLRSLRIAADTSIIPFAAYYVTRRLVTNAERQRRFIRTMGVLSLALIVSGLIERMLHQGFTYRVRGPFDERNYYFVVIATIFFMVLTDWLSRKDLGKKWPAALPQGLRSILLFCSPVMVFLTLTRGNILGFLMAMGVFALLGRHLTMAKRKLGILALVLLLSPVFVFSTVLLTPRELIEERLGQDTVSARLRAFEVAVFEGLKHPFIGIGHNNLLFVYGTIRKSERSLPSAHNVYLTLFAELGLFGLVAYMGLTVSILRQGWQLYRAGPQAVDRWWGIGIIAILAAYLIPPLANNLQLRPSLCHVYVFASLGAIVGLYSPHRPSPWLLPPPLARTAALPREKREKARTHGADGTGPRAGGAALTRWSSSEEESTL
jgi:O-antigen ligase